MGREHCRGASARRVTELARATMQVTEGRAVPRDVPAAHTRSARRTKQASRSSALTVTRTGAQRRLLRISARCSGQVRKCALLPGRRRVEAREAPVWRAVRGAVVVLNVDHELSYSGRLRSGAGRARPGDRPRLLRVARGRFQQRPLGRRYRSRRHDLPPHRRHSVPVALGIGGSGGMLLPGRKRHVCDAVGHGACAHVYAGPLRPICGS